MRKLAEDVEALRAEEAEEKKVKKVKMEMMMNDDDVGKGEEKEDGDNSHCLKKNRFEPQSPHTHSF